MQIVTPADHPHAHGGDPAQISSSPINMSPACIRGVATHLLNARITFDKFHVVAAASIALDRTRRTLQKDASRLLPNEREVLQRKQISVVTAMLQQWCTNVMRSKVEPMQNVARMVRRHMDGVVAWTHTQHEPQSTRGSDERKKLSSNKKAAERKRRGFFMCVALLVTREAQRALLASGLSRLPIVRYFAHRQLDAATVVEVQYHHVDFLAHLQHIFHALNALIGNL